MQIVSAESRVPMKIEIIVYDRIGPYKNGQVVELDDGPFLRALLKGGKADVLNPPDWDPDTADKAAIDSIYEEPKVNPKAFQEDDSPDQPKRVEYGTRDTEQSTNRETPSHRSNSRKGPRKKSPESPKEAQGDRPKGYGGPGQLSQDREESRTGKDSN